MKCPKIYKAKAIDDRTLVIKFTNQEVKKYDISHLLKNSMFAPLCQAAFFKNFRIEPGGYGILWNEDIDLSEYELWNNGVTIDKRDQSVAL